MEQKTKENLIDAGIWAAAIGLLVSAAIGVGDEELIEKIAIASENLSPLDKESAFKELASIADTLPPETLKDFGIYFAETPVAPQSTLAAYNLEDGRVMLVDANILKDNADDLLAAANDALDKSSKNLGYAGGLGAGLAGYRSLRDGPEPTFAERVKPNGEKTDNWKDFIEQQRALQSNYLQHD